MEVTASTVGEYFDTSVNEGVVAEQIDSVREQDAQREKQKKDAAATAATNSGEGISADWTMPPRIPESGTGTKASEATITTKSFAAAYNAWNRAEQKNGSVEFADQIKFEIDSEIAKSKIVDPKKNSIRDVPATTAKCIIIILVNMHRPQVPHSFSASQASLKNAQPLEYLIHGT
jgi:hypothetical protein